MIKTRLVRLLSHAKKYIVYNVLWQWVTLLSQITAVFMIADLLEQVLSFVNLRACMVLLICVPLIPVSIVLVQKFAKRLLNKYWGIYTNLGDSFLENLQGLTTLKIYQADEQKAEEMDAESQHFRKVTMKVLTMQLNSTSVMDIIAYGGAAVGMIVAVNDFLQGRVGLLGTVAIVLLASEFFIPLVKCYQVHTGRWNHSDHQRV